MAALCCFLSAFSALGFVSLHQKMRTKDLHGTSADVNRPDMRLDLGEGSGDFINVPAHGSGGGMDTIHVSHGFLNIVVHGCQGLPERGQVLIDSETKIVQSLCDNLGLIPVVRDEGWIV
jgi:hypothetical protein